MDGKSGVLENKVELFSNEIFFKQPFYFQEKWKYYPLIVAKLKMLKVLIEKISDLGDQKLTLIYFYEAFLCKIPQCSASRFMY